MTTLLTGFDSAWTATKSGAIVGVLATVHIGLPLFFDVNRFGESRTTGVIPLVSSPSIAHVSSSMRQAPSSRNKMTLPLPYPRVLRIGSMTPHAWARSRLA
jgi:hypothetical protein